MWATPQHFIVFMNLVFVIIIQKCAHRNFELTSSERRLLSVEFTSLGVTGNNSGVSIRDGKSNLGSEPDRVSAVAFLKLIGSNFDGSGIGPEYDGKTRPAPLPPKKMSNHQL